jgi:hypothetical protein
MRLGIQKPTPSVRDDWKAPGLADDSRFAARCVEHGSRRLANAARRDQHGHHEA